ncbi:MAG: Mur ligase family protein [Candidatus Paceibacterota bacterium]|jgi:UDP-N-acetylmuramoylalanine--D-glutamate ligase
MLVDMKNWQNFFKGKKITQMGLGLLGRGVGDAAFLAKWGADLLVTDLKSKKELAPSLKKLKKYNQPKAGRPRAGNITYHLGEHRLRDFSAQGGSASGERNRDFILKAAGVPLASSFIAEARKNKIPIEMDASLFFKLMPKGVTFVGVTGTRGKTTTAYLIYEILKRLNLKDKKGSTFLAGNIKDTATLPLLEKVREGDFVVAELDSWQLQGFGEARISPHIAVFTTFLPDHLNYYGGDMKKYFADKANIFKYQKKDDTLILGEQITRLNLTEQKGSTFKNLKSKKIVAYAADISNSWRLKILGEHNRVNAACALVAARVLKIPDEISRKAIENFGGVPGRLEFMREIHGVKIYNDTCSTTPDATVAALLALNSPFEKGGGQRPGDLKIPPPAYGGVLPLQKGELRKIILILGGSDKSLDMSELMREIPKFCKAVVLLPGNGTDKIKNQISKIKITIQNVKNLGEALKQAIACSGRGDIILFSPAFASFGMFVNEYDRGDKFVKLVEKYERN